jgi:hypothetical protein
MTPIPTRPSPTTWPRIGKRPFFRSACMVGDEGRRDDGIAACTDMAVRCDPHVTPATQTQKTTKMETLFLSAFITPCLV